jgi:hypothetical protein
MAQNSAQISVTTSATARLWQTSTGVSPDVQTTLAGNATGQIFRAGTVNDPVPIVIENLDATNPVYLGPSTVTSSTGTKLVAGGSITRNVVGNDSEFAISTGGTVAVAVEVGRQ